MTECRTITADHSTGVPVTVGRLAPGEAQRYHHDLSEDADCQGVGVSISNVVAAIRAEDDDGLLAIGAPAISGLTWSNVLTADPDPTQRMYAIAFTITLSDARTVIRDMTVPVLKTRVAHA